MADNETKQIFTVTQSRRRSGRNTFTDRKGAYTDEYIGYFKVVDDSIYDENGDIIEYRVRVIDGKNPDSEYCGITDIGNVSATTINSPAGKNIYLTARWVDENGRYDVFIDTAPAAENPDCYYLLAEVDSNMNINQRWVGEVINFGERFLI